jgi:hypothetical protein
MDFERELHALRVEDVHEVTGRDNLGSVRTGLVPGMLAQARSSPERKPAGR